MTVIWIILIVFAFFMGLFAGWGLLLQRISQAGYAVEFQGKETKLYKIEKHPL